MSSTMRVLVDTSVWRAYFRGRGLRAPTEIPYLLEHDAVAVTEITRLELLNSVATEEITQIDKLLSAIPTFAAQRRTWRTVEKWINITAGLERRYDLRHLLVAVVAHERQIPIWSLHPTIAELAELGFIDLYDPKTRNRTRTMSSGVHRLEQLDSPDPRNVSGSWRP